MRVRRNGGGKGRERGETSIFISNLICPLGEPVFNSLAEQTDRPTPP